ncbi:MAG: GNAT family N-acetyltransferase [Kiritimatiellaeota bacterium]|nr:GNAT family N-acetyltransferase [Kiritimatiellota bacterium]
MNCCNIRLETATPAQAEAIHRLIQPLARRGLLLPRSIEEVRTAAPPFITAEADGRIVGCVVLRDYGDGLAEVRSLAVQPDWNGQGLGSRLVARAVETARRDGFTWLFALTRRPNLFRRLGFHVVPKERFPKKVWTDCARCPIRDHCDEFAMMLPLDTIPSKVNVPRRETAVSTIPPSNDATLGRERP